MAEAAREAIRHDSDQSYPDFDGRLPTSRRKEPGFHPGHRKTGSEGCLIEKKEEGSRWEGKLRNVDEKGCE